MATTGISPDTGSGPAPAPTTFGTVFAEQMSVTRWQDGEWAEPRLAPVEPLSLHPAAHALHYGSACFEGLKAHRGADGTVRVFRLGRHVQRLQASADVLVLPVPPTELLTQMVLETVAEARGSVPAAPGSLYLRPTLIGTEANIGAAARPSDEAMLFVLASPVGDYFAGGLRALALAVETERPRTTPQFGSVKTGANYAMALGTARRAARQVGADQVLFAPGGRVEETGASNIVLVDDTRIVTPELTDGFLHGVTRDSVLRLAPTLGYAVEERPVSVEELLAWCERPDAEVALTGTAAGLAPVGRLVHDGRAIPVGTGEAGPHTLALRQALGEIHTAIRPDPGGWLTAV